MAWLSDMWVSILLVFKCRMGCVPKAGSNSQRCPSEPCPLKLWQKELLFSHRPGGLCPPREQLPHVTDSSVNTASRRVTKWGFAAVTSLSRLFSLLLLLLLLLSPYFSSQCISVSWPGFTFSPPTLPSPDVQGQKSPVLRLFLTFTAPFPLAD